MLYTKTYDNPSTDLQVHTFGTQKCQPGHFYGYAIREHYLLHYVHTGHGIYIHGGHITNLGPGDSFLIRPGEPTYYRADDNIPWDYSWVSFSGRSADALLDAAGYFNAGLSISGSADSAASADPIFRKMKLFSGHEGGCHGIAGLLLAFLTEAAITAGDSDIRESGDYVSSIKRFIATEYHHRITVAGIADLLNLDRSYMSSLFKKRTGVSIQEYILNYRIGKAETLLRESILPIKDIALSVGYADQLAFSKIFKSRKGISPLNYRKSG